MNQLKPKFGVLTEQLNLVEGNLVELKDEISTVIEESKDLAQTYETGIFLTRHISGGRIYLRWRIRHAVNNNRSYINLISPSGIALLRKLPNEAVRQMKHLDLRCQVLNYHYSVEFSKRKSLKQFLTHLSAWKSALGATPTGQSFGHN